MQDMLIETAQAMHSIQLSMSYSTAVTKLAMDAQETMGQAVTELMNAAAPAAPAPVIPAGQYIDTYA